MDRADKEIDEILARLVDMVWAKTRSNPESVSIVYNFEEAKASLLQYMDRVAVEAYKKGYIAKGIDELFKHENDKGSQL